MYAALMAFLGVSMVAAASDPVGFSHRGKFFYTQVNYEPDDTQHYYINVGLGCDGFQQKWTVTALEESAGYVTSICNEGANRCKVPRKFPWGIDAQNPSDECVKDISQAMINEYAYLNDGQESAFIDPIPHYMLQGYSA